MQHDPPPAAPVIVSITIGVFGRLQIVFDQPMETVPVDPTNWIWQRAGGFHWFGSAFNQWRTETSLWIDGTEGVVPADNDVASYLATVPDVRSALLVPCAQTLNFPIG